MDKLFRREVGGKSEFGFDTEQPKVASVANRMSETFDSYFSPEEQERLDSRFHGNDSAGAGNDRWISFSGEK